MIKLAIVVAVCLVSGMAQALDKPYYDLENAEELFHDFIKQHGKSYSRQEYFKRLEIFKKNLKSINRQNSEHPETVFGVNKFADLEPEEFEQYYYGFKPTNETGVEVVLNKSVVAPPSFDWRDKDAVTHVKDQGRCGSCFIFSAIGNIEGQYAIKHKQCIALSEGQALDCLDCGTCGGGWMQYVMQEFAKRAGVMKEEDYPYKPEKRSCREDTQKVVAHVLGGEQLRVPTEEVLLNKLIEIGPLAVSIAAGDGFRYYTSGIMHPNYKNCAQNINHGVLLVGYGEDKNGTKYWIIKNSWGEDWGEKGYLRLLRGVYACRMGTSYTASATVA